MQTLLAYKSGQMSPLGLRLYRDAIDISVYSFPNGTPSGRATNSTWFLWTEGTQADVFGIVTKVTIGVLATQQDRLFFRSRACTDLVIWLS